MKTLKILLYILLAFVVFVLTGILVYFLAEPAFREQLLSCSRVSTDIALQTRRINKHTILVILELIALVVCSLASLLTTVVNWKKPQGGYFAGSLLIIPLILDLLLLMNGRALYNSLDGQWRDFHIMFRYLHMFFLEILVWVLLVDVIFLLLDGFLRSRNSKSNPTAPTQPAPVQSAATELKQFKELLDLGAITQDEYDAKKKQLLGLPTSDNAPAASQKVGKCMMCGQADVPLETVEVVVAGMSRKRTLCKNCASKFK